MTHSSRLASYGIVQILGSIAHICALDSQIKFAYRVYTGKLERMSKHVEARECHEFLGGLSHWQARKNT